MKIKIALFIVIIVNLIILSLRWIYWMLDDQYGYGYEIRSDLNDEGNGFNALKSMYNEILWDIYYSMGFTLLIAVLLIVLAIYNNNRDIGLEKDNKRECQTCQRDDSSII